MSTSRPVASEELDVRLLDRGVEVAQERGRAGDMQLEAAAGGGSARSSSIDGRMRKISPEERDRTVTATSPLSETSPGVWTNGSSGCRRRAGPRALAGVRGDRAPVRRGQPAGAAIDEQDRLLVAAGEASRRSAGRLGGL